MVIALLNWPIIAQSFTIGAIQVGQAWARATPLNASAAAVYVTLFNTGNSAETLVSATTPIARSVTLHQTHFAQGVTTMQQIAGLTLIPNQPVGMGPGGLHLMLSGLTQPLNAGDRFPLILRFSKSGSIQIQVKVGSAKAMSAPH